MFMAPIIFANYELRKDFIIKNYCVNKNRPEMHCDGKCYLAKQLEKAEQEDQKQATGNFISKILSFESDFKTNLLPTFSRKSIYSKRRFTLQNFGFYFFKKRIFLFPSSSNLIVNESLLSFQILIQNSAC